MTEVSTTTPPAGDRLALLVPGLPHLRRGRHATGLACLALALLLSGTAIAARGRIAATLGEGGRLDEWVALATLVLGLALAWGIGWWAGRLDPLAAGRSQWAIAASEFRRNGLAVAGLYLMVLLYVVTLLTPYLAPYDPSIQTDIVATRYLSPSPTHLMGTDRFGRDILSRVLYGARISLSIGFIAMGIAVTLGTAIGAIAGFFGRAVDTVLMRFVDMLISFPRLVLVVAVIAIFEPSIQLVIAVLGLTLWPSIARIVRGEVLSLREREFVQAARALGLSDARIIARHVVPNVLAPVIVAATLGIGNTILLEAGLSFLGFGVQPPTPSWGNMVSMGRNVLVRAWWVATFPGLAIVFTVVAFNLIGDGLRDALDPRLRR